jgi:hypothetical protein
MTHFLYLSLMFMAKLIEKTPSTAKTVRLNSNELFGKYKEEE